MKICQRLWLLALFLVYYQVSIALRSISKENDDFIESAFSLSFHSTPGVKEAKIG